MVCVPVPSVVLVNVAMPLAFSVPVPRVVLPSMNVTVPVGVPVPATAAVTVAVKVTAWPKTDGLAYEVTTVFVAARTLCVRTAEVLVRKLESPL